AQRRAARLARLDGLLREAAAALDRAERADEAAAPAEWEAARVALGQAGEVAAGGADAARGSRLRALKQRAAEVDRVRALLAALESIRGRRAEHRDNRRSDTEYAAAFRTAGLDLDAMTPAEAGTWIARRSSPVELAAYLDDWAGVRR